MATRIHVIADSNINYGLLYDKDSEGQVNVDPEVVVTRDYFNEIKADIQKEITNETTRAKEAEKELETAISGKSDRDHTHTIDDITSLRWTLAEMDVNTNSNLRKIESLQTEISTKASTDDLNTVKYELQNTISTETTRATSKENEINQLLVAEITRATNAEKTITDNLNVETTRATAKENEINTKITQETTRATGKENEISAELSTEITRATNAENKLTNDLTSHINDFNTKNTQIESSITTINGNITKLKNEKLNVSGGTINGDLKINGVLKLFGDTDSADLRTDDGIVSIIKTILIKLGMPQSNIVEP